MRKLIFCIALLHCFAAQAQTESAEPAIKQYLDCARIAVPSLDDTTSDAGTIAIGVHAQCRSALSEANLNSERRDSIAQALRPTLVQFVLLYRVGKRKNSKT